MSLKVRPVARVFAILYGLLSPFLVILMAVSKTEYLRIPLGIIAPPLLYLNINFDIQHPTRFLSGVLLMLFGAACYAVTGWLTGAAAVLCFNFIARRTGGIEASILTEERPNVELTAQHPLPD
ncbi:MAG: hypothetical protein WBW85_12165 [Terriglobales bacterium]